MLTAAEIRQKYVDFFVERGHAHVQSAPLVPPDDPTLMFTSAGMVQFKALYSGAVPLPYARAVTVQKCLRAGGKGSDLENVGKTLRHHTFFEMLGNFSFGDYFKRDAIKWGWDFCTDPKWLGLPADRIWPTVFGKQDAQGNWTVDEEAEGFWKNETGCVNPVIRLNEKENFWGPAGETGACGPCSEIKFFMGTEAQLHEYQALGKTGKPEDIAKISHDLVELGDLFLEIWNLVFPQYDQQLDGARLPLKNRGIDTGAGLERTTTAVQFWQSGGKVNSPYETDLLAPLVSVVSELAKLPYPMLAGGALGARASRPQDAPGASISAEDEIKQRGFDLAAVRLAMNACADHARALTFTLSEGIVPSNEGRGYVLRRILRRAARFGRKIGLTEPFLWKLVDPVVKTMGGVYPEITKYPDVVAKTIRAEEESFNRTLNQGGERLDEILANLKSGETLGGDEAYKLYDTYGFPLDLTIETAEERGIAVDIAGYDRALAEGKARARASWKGGAGGGVWADLLKDLSAAQKTAFEGYDKLASEARLLAIIEGERRVERLEAGRSGVLVFDRTPFYAEAGGQIGDKGKALGENGALGFLPVFSIEDTQKIDAGFYLHFGEALEPLAVGQTLRLEVDAARRSHTIRNHSVVHLMQGALKRLIGQHVTQQGSFVGPEGMRFDFTNPEAVPEKTLREIERVVNGVIADDLPVTTNVMTLEEARRTGAIAPFGEKYGAVVRVVSMGEGDTPFSREFCGGTHVTHTGDIQKFLITAESSVASGIRRIEGIAGEGAKNEIARRVKIVDDLAAEAGVAAKGDEAEKLETLSRVARNYSVPMSGLESRVKAMLAELDAPALAELKSAAAELEDFLLALPEKVKAHRRKLDEARAERARAQMVDAVKDVKEIGGIRVLCQRLDGAGHDALAQAWDAARAQLKDRAVGLFYSVDDGKVNMIAGATPDIAPSRISAGDVLREAAAIVGGKGGGKPTMARGGGSQADRAGMIDGALAGIIEKVLK